MSFTAEDYIDLLHEAYTKTRDMNDIFLAYIFKKNIDDVRFFIEDDDTGIDAFHKLFRQIDVIDVWNKNGTVLDSIVWRCLHESKLALLLLDLLKSGESPDGEKINSVIRTSSE